MTTAGTARVHESSSVIDTASRHSTAIDDGNGRVHTNPLDGRPSPVALEPKQRSSTPSFNESDSESDRDSRATSSLPAGRLTVLPSVAPSSTESSVYHRYPPAAQDQLDQRLRVRQDTDVGKQGLGSPSSTPSRRPSDIAPTFGGVPARRPSWSASAASEEGRPRSLHQTGAQSQTQTRQRWKTVDVVRLAVAFTATLSAGMSDSSLGALLDSMQIAYDLSYSVVSMIFLANCAGYFASSVSTTWLIHRFGLTRTLTLAALVNALASLVLSFRPPFPVLVTGLVLTGFGSGINDAACSTYVALFASHSLFMTWYASFGIGACATPLMISAMLKRGVQWQRYYYVPVALASVVGVCEQLAFRNYQMPDDGESGQQQAAAPTTLYRRFLTVIRMPAVLAGAVTMALAFSTADILSSWSASFLITLRNGDPALMRLPIAGFWGGQTIGRIFLSFTIAKLGDAVVLLYVAICILPLAVMQWVPNIPVDAVAIAVVGLFQGPIIPIALSTVSKRVPPTMVPPVVSVLTGAGVVASAIAPLLVGLAGNGHLYVGAIDIVLVCAMCASWAWSMQARKKLD